MIKRAADLIASLLLAIVLAPVMLAAAAAVALALGRPVVFAQKRPGLNGRLFTLYKFRTMKNALHDDGTPLSDAERLTRLGRILRATSIDELPELLNVIRGDMSLVGPRPLLPEYLERYSPFQGRRHEVRPGITGWAQVNGRNTLSWEDKFALDVWYVDHRNLLLDAKILLMTVGKVFRREGISQAGEATIQPFMGSSDTGGKA